MRFDPEFLLPYIGQPPSKIVCRDEIKSIYWQPFKLVAKNLFDLIR